MEGPQIATEESPKTWLILMRQMEQGTGLTFEEAMTEDLINEFLQGLAILDSIS